MRIKVLMLTIVILSLSGVTWGHPLKMSYSKITISSGGHVELETRIALDDLTLHIQNLYGLYQIDFSVMESDGAKALQRYLQDHFYFVQDGKKLNLQINAVSQNRTALILNMTTAGKLDATKEVFLVNTLLCDASVMQTNYVKHEDKYHMLSIGNPKVKIQIN
ncbi:MAG: DUF6702 family protein [Bacteroidota bacterium]